MKKLCKALLLIGIVALACTGVSARDRRPGPSHHGRPNHSYRHHHRGPSNGAYITRSIIDGVSRVLAPPVVVYPQPYIYPAPIPSETVIIERRITPPRYIYR